MKPMSLNIVLTVTALLAIELPAFSQDLDPSVIRESWAYPCGNRPSAGCAIRLSFGDSAGERQAYIEALMTAANTTVATGGVGCSSAEAYTKYYSIKEGSLSMESCHRLAGGRRVRLKGCDANDRVCRFLDLAEKTEFWTEIHNVQALN